MKNLKIVVVLCVLVPGAAALGAAAPGAAAPGAAASELEQEAGRRIVELVSAAAALVAEQGLSACDAFKQEAGEWRRGDSYVFVIDLAGQVRCHPSRPTLEGRATLEIRDPDGKPIVQLMLRQLAGDSDEGWVHYLWPRPGETVLRWKSTYVRAATAPGGERYLVGSGVYGLELEKAFVVDRVREAARLIAAGGRAAFDVLRDPGGGFRFFDCYVFVMDADGVMLVNPAFPEMEGQFALDIEDQQGISPGQEMLELLASREEGWVSYFWPRPDGSRARASQKQTFVRRVRLGDQLLVVGAGLYDDG